MNTQHTPGPWTAAEQFDGSESLGIAVSAGRQEIVRIHDIGREGFANAAVIAAAPDLLGALIAAERELAYHASTRHNRELPSIRAAIARATGANA